MTRTPSTFLLLITFFVTSCSSNGPLPYPRASVGPYSEQLIIQSASHWDVIAKNETDSISSALALNSSVFVSESADTSSPFKTAYHNFLISNLVQDGIGVFTEPENTQYQLDYEFQVVKHRKEGFQRLRPGVISAFIIAGVFLDNVQQWDNQSLALIPIAAVAEGINAFWPDSRAQITEVIVTTRLLNGTRIVTANSQVYYFNETDMINYREGRFFQVVGI